MFFRKHEINWLKEHFPNLKIDQEFWEINGTLDFTASYDAKQDKVILDCENYNNNTITGNYKIKIKFSTEEYFKIFDVENVIENFSKKKNIPRNYIHFSPDRSACIAGPIRWNEIKKDIKNSNNRVEKIIYLAIQFFYHQTYVLKFKKEPWKGFSHGQKGAYEEKIAKQRDLISKSKHYYDTKIPLDIKCMLKNKPNKNDQCPCGSGKKYKKCHLHQVEKHLISVGGRRTINLFQRNNL